MFCWGRNRNQDQTTEPERDRTIPENARLVEDLTEVGQALLEPGVNVVIFKSEVLEKHQAELTEFVHYRTMGFESSGKPEDLKSAFEADWSRTGNRSAQLAEEVAEELRKVVEFLARFKGEDSATLQVETITNNPSDFPHVDDPDLGKDAEEDEEVEPGIRATGTIAMYKKDTRLDFRSGGLEYYSDKNVKRDSLEAYHDERELINNTVKDARLRKDLLDELAEQHGIFELGDYSYSLEVGEIAFYKTGLEQGLVHRSPDYVKGDRRLWFRAE